MLEDFAAVALAFLDLYGLTFDTSWLRLSRAITERTIELFHDPASDTWYDTASDHERLLVRPRDATDNATPSGTSLVAELLLEWAELDDIHEWRHSSERIVSRVGEAIAQYPQALGHVAGVADALVNGGTQVAMVGDPSDARFHELVGAMASVFVPTLVFAGGNPTAEGQPALHARSNRAWRRPHGLRLPRFRVRPANAGPHARSERQVKSPGWGWRQAPEPQRQA